MFSKLDVRGKAVLNSGLVLFHEHLYVIELNPAFDRILAGK